MERTVRAFRGRGVPPWTAAWPDAAVAATVAAYDRSHWRRFAGKGSSFVNAERQTNASQMLASWRQTVAAEPEAAWIVEPADEQMGV